MPGSINDVLCSYNDVKYIIRVPNTRDNQSDLAKVDAHPVTKAEHDEAPVLTREMLERTEIRHGNKVIKRGRPPLEHPKEAIKLRIDREVLAAYRRTGSGWQTRINADLRKAARKLTG